MSEKLYRRMINNQTTAVILLNKSLHVDYVNNAAESLLESSGSRLQGLHIDEIFGEPGLTGNEFSAALETGQPYTKRKSLLKVNGTNSITIDYTVTPISGDDQPYLVLEIFSRDRWLRISREENLLEQQQASKSLIRGFAHEIKNPLGGIRGAAQLLERELDNKNLEEYTRVIIDESDRLRSLVDQMLGPYIPADFYLMNVHEALERVRNLVESEAGNAVTIIRDYDPSIPEIMGNRELMIQALLNIIRNAMQAVQETDRSSGGEIRLTTRAVRQITLGNQRHRIVCRIDIGDNGPGIPGDIQDTIFYPMVSGRAKGTGLGLTIAQRIINQHQGLIEFTSNPGNTCFTLFIPLPPDFAEQPGSDPSRSTP